MDIDASVVLAAIDEVEEFLACLLIVSHFAQHRARYRFALQFLDSAHHHTHVPAKHEHASFPAKRTHARIARGAHARCLRII